MSDRFDYSEAEKKKIFDEAKSHFLTSFREFKVEEDKGNKEGTIKKLASLVDSLACFRAIDVIFFNRDNAESIAKCEAITDACLERAIKLIKG
jgi:hypothetical protein